MSKKVSFSVEIPNEYDKKDREAIAQDIIDFIVDRTKKGKDKRNQEFTGEYSAGYAKSIDFKNAGKSRSNINLTLSGDMLGNMEVIKNVKGKLEIGYTASNEAAGRAEGNILGTYGNKKQVAPKRDFLGITKNDLEKKILSKYPIEDIEEKRKRTEKVLKAIAGAKEFIK